MKRACFGGASHDWIAGIAVKRYTYGDKLSVRFSTRGMRL